MTESKNVPEIRFRKFESAWQPFEFGDLITEYCEKTTSENEDTLLSCSIDGMFLNSELFSHQRGQSNIGYLKIKKGDLILSAQNLHLGNANVNLRFQHGIISPAYKVYSVDGCKQEFLHVWIKRDSTKRFFLNATTAGASLCRKNIEWSSLYRQIVMLPSPNEQETIAQYLISLDNAITKREYQKQRLQVLKKSMLEKMIPSNDSISPELRFSEYTHRWEYRTFSSLFSEYSEKNHCELPVLTIMQGKGTILRKNTSKHMSYDQSTTSSYKLVRKGDFIVHLRSFEGGLEKANSDGIISPAYHTLHGNGIDTAFYYLYFRSCDFIHNKLKNCVYGIRDGRSIDIDEMMKIKIPYTSIEEQQKIAAYFKNLDSLINAVEGELVKIRTLKRILLEKMFI